jgi:hypothetical protein
VSKSRGGRKSEHSASVPWKLAIQIAGSREALVQDRPDKTTAGWKEVPAYVVMPFLLDRFKAMTAEDRRRTDPSFRRAVAMLAEIFESGDRDLWHGISVNLDAISSMARARSKLQPG